MYLLEHFQDLFNEDELAAATEAELAAVAKARFYEQATKSKNLKIL